MTYPKQVRVVEVGPRDGLQNEPSTVPAEAKVALIEALADAGLTSIEAGSFVSPGRVPQMADTKNVLEKRCAPDRTSATPSWGRTSTVWIKPSHAGCVRSRYSAPHRRASPSATSTAPSRRAWAASRRS